MFSSKKTIRLILVVAFLCVFGGWTFGQVPDVVGTFGVTSIEPNSAVAIWVPIEAGEAIEGVRWYNNDSSVVFPEVLAVAGEYGHPELLEAATQVATEVSGDSMQWSEAWFSQPVSSTSTGLYLILRLPVGSEFEFEGSGGGSGIGYFAGGSVNNCWLTEDGVDWYSLVPEFQMAFLPLPAANKSFYAGVAPLVLSPPVDTNVRESDRISHVARNYVSAYPNPFNPNTRIRFVLDSASPVELDVFDARGSLVRRLVRGDWQAGEHFGVFRVSCG